MEAGGDVPNQLPVLPPLAPAVQHLDTIRALHQTVVALRVALEKSRGELQELRQKVQTHIDTSVYVDTIERLSLENHILRQQVLGSEGHNVLENESQIKIEGASPCPSAATYTLSPIPDNMDSSPCGKNGSLAVASPKDKSKDSSYNLTSPRATSTPTETAIKSSLAMSPNPSVNSSKEGRQEVTTTFRPTFSDSGKTASANGIKLTNAALADANEGDESDGDQEHSADKEGDAEAGTETEEVGETETGARGGHEAESEDEDDDAGDSEELDDIELIFTTEETKELGVLQEDLVPIADAEEDGEWPPLQFASADGDGPQPPPPGQPLASSAAPSSAPAPAPSAPAFTLVSACSLRAAGEREARGTAGAAGTAGPGAGAGAAPDVSPDGPPAGRGGGADAVGRAEWARSVLIETDISKCGVVDEGLEAALSHLSRRNTLPAPLGFPTALLLPARDAGGLGASLAARPYAVKFAASNAGTESARRGSGGGGGGGGARGSGPRPILVERGRGPRRESEAQTDITALPAHWRSESALAQKVSPAFTTLPSKFALPEAVALGGGGYRGTGGGAGVSGAAAGGGGGGGRRVGLRLADKTQEARRALLSDINFTSMVPELSRSADHLCGEEGAAGDGALQGQGFPAAGLLRQYPRAFSYMKNADFGLASGAGAGCGGGCGGGASGPLVSPYGGASFTRDGSKDTWSPCTCTCTCACACSHSRCCRQSSWDSYSSASGVFGSGAGVAAAAGGGAGATRYRGSMSALDATGKLRRHSWRTEARSCGALSGGGGGPPRSWGSVPSSPTHHAHRAPPPASIASRALRGPCSGDGGGWASGAHCSGGSAGRPGGYPPGERAVGGGGAIARTHTKRKGVTFDEAGVGRRVQPGQSLPDLRAAAGSDWEADSGDSTDSLIDEAEEFLRRSIDSILTGADVSRVGRRRQLRRYSQPDPIRELAPPQSAQPFLPKVPRDLKLDYFVKVITAEGRVMVGRVRYVGSVPGRSEPHVGVELPKAAGDSDGSFQGRRFFDCDPDSALFVPFKKVVMAWSV